MIRRNKIRQRIRNLITQTRTAKKNKKKQKGAINKKLAVPVPIQPKETTKPK